MQRVRRSGAARLALVTLAPAVVLASAYLLVSAQPPRAVAGLRTGESAAPTVAQPTSSLPEASAIPRPASAPALAKVTVAGWHVPVLLYHRIAIDDGQPHPNLYMPPAVFAAQLAAIRAAGWHTITAAQLGADLLAGTRPPPKTFVITFDDGWGDGATTALPDLLADGFVATYYVISDRVGRPSYLSTADLETMAADGMEIADHTTDHEDLVTVPPAIAVEEIDEAAAWIDRTLGAPPMTFAYPYGIADPAVVSDVRLDGFEIAFTDHRGCLESTATRFLLPRIEVGPGVTPAGLVATLDRCG